MKNAHPQTNASALVITLAFLVLITVLVVGIMDTVRTERISANSNLEALQSDYFAQMGVERVVATLQQQTAPQQLTTSTNNVYSTSVYNWISQPGQLIVASSTTGILSGTGTIPLYSGTATTGITDPNFIQPNLNVATFRNPNNYVITGSSSVQMPVAWIYVRKNGNVDTAIQPTTDTTNPIVGRYAYWTDDESSKINYNLAWGRNGNSSPCGDPSNVDLTALRTLEPPFSQDDANSLHNFVSGSNGRVFNTPEDARQVGTDVANALEAYKFNLTHYNSDPDRTFFNEPRIVLTTQVANVPKKADGTPALPFINILKNGNEDPGGVLVSGSSAISGANLTATIKMLNSYLMRSDWPMAPGKTFQEKYYGTGATADRLTQLSLNIIDYVRCKESKNAIVTPLRGDWSGDWTKDSSTFTLAIAGGANAYVGVSRAPYITEMAVFIPSPTTIVSGSCHYQGVKFKMEIYLPPSYGLSSIDVSKLRLSVGLTGIAAVYDASTFTVSIPSNTDPTSTLLSAGNYAVLTFTMPGELVYSTKTNGGRPTSRSVNAALALPPMADQGTTGDRINVCPLDGSTSIAVPISATSVTEDLIPSVEVDDPRINQYFSDWLTTGTNTLGKIKKIKSTIGNSPQSIVPQQDTDSNGLITAESLYMPPPAGSTYTRPDGTGDVNSAGKVTSIGELGYICTGVQSVFQAGVPWRTLRLQPNNDTSATPAVPDWALMDLFTVPVSTSSNAKAVFQPNGTSYGGRVNLNCHVDPFNIQRILPLAAVFQGCPYDSTSLGNKISPETAQSIAQHIYDHLTATGKNIGQLYNFPNGYYSPGEIVEIAGVADKGEASEELVRQVSNLLTARGNVFTVYTIGQTIKQTPSGQLKVTGERRLQAMVEGYVYDTATGEVRFRTLYYKKLTP
jgi:Tfp pilus assembly protein PilX